MTKASESKKDQTPIKTPKKIESPKSFLTKEIPKYGI